MSVIDPQTWADAEDGRALRELREAAPEASAFGLQQWLNRPFYTVTVWPEPMGELDPKYIARASGQTIAETADRCREALRDA